MRSLQMDADKVSNHLRSKIPNNLFIHDEGNTPLIFEWIHEKAPRGVILSRSATLQPGGFLSSMLNRQSSMSDITFPTAPGPKIRPNFPLSAISNPSTAFLMAWTIKTKKLKGASCRQQSLWASCCIFDNLRIICIRCHRPWLQFARTLSCFTFADLVRSL